MASFSIIHWIVFSTILLLMFSALKGIFAKKGRVSDDSHLVCTTCGSRGDPTTITRGSIWIEIVLWCFFLIPGLIYTIWRLTTRSKACPACGAPSMVPINSPVGKRLIEK